MIRRNFSHLDIDEFRLIYKIYVKFFIRAWSPHFVKDIEVLEKVQKAAAN